MGTRSLTVFVESEEFGGEEIAVMYRQMDGYPTGHGAELKEYLSTLKLVNGIGADRTKIANGMGCLAALTVAHFKGQEAGGFYLYPAKSRDCGEEYIYTVYPGKDGVINLRVQSGAVTFFGLPGTKQANMGWVYDGPVTDFDPAKAEEQAKDIRATVRNDYIEEQKAKEAQASLTPPQATAIKRVLANQKRPSDPIAKDLKRARKLSKI